MTTENGPSIKDENAREALRESRAIRVRSAQIANACANFRRHPKVTKGRNENYEYWTKDALYQRARKLSISGRSEMTKPELIEALRNR